MQIQQRSYREIYTAMPKQDRLDVTTLPFASTLSRKMKLPVNSISFCPATYTESAIKIPTQ